MLNIRKDTGLISCGDWVMVETVFPSEAPIEGWLMSVYCPGKELHDAFKLGAELDEMADNSRIDGEILFPLNITNTERERILGGDPYKALKVYDVKRKKEHFIMYTYLKDIQLIPYSFELEDAAAMVELSLVLKNKEMFMKYTNFLKACGYFDK